MQLDFLRFSWRCFAISPGSFFSSKLAFHRTRACPEGLTREASGRHRNEMPEPPHVAPPRWPSFSPCRYTLGEESPFTVTPQPCGLSMLKRFYTSRSLRGRLLGLFGGRGSGTAVHTLFHAAATCPTAARKIRWAQTAPAPQVWFFFFSPVSCGKGG